MVNASSNKEANAGYDTNSEGKGWYEDMSYREEMDDYITHTTGYYGVNNIYDMAGNVYELTTENSTGVSWLVERGGCYCNSGSDDPAAYRTHSDDYTTDSVGFRVVLYK